jgi:hypothetical protein
MRRFFSIAAIAVLVFQVLSPLVAAACPHTTQAPAYHRAQQQAQPAQHGHCDGMRHEHQTEPTAPNSETPSLAAVDSSENCPMDCCGASVVTNAAAVAAATPLPSLVATDQSCGFVPVTFATPGFSSHTDRGPPAA